MGLSKFGTAQPVLRDEDEKDLPPREAVKRPSPEDQQRLAREIQDEARDR